MKNIHHPRFAVLAFLLAGSVLLAACNQTLPVTSTLEPQVPTALPLKSPLPATLEPTSPPDATITLAPTLPPEPTEEGFLDEKGVPMIFIPAGEFQMGHPDIYFANEINASPVHTVRLDAFYIDKYEVTNTRYYQCIKAEVCERPSRSPKDHEQQGANYPEVWVDWYMATAYCEWRGARLPTEAEWEFAARGTDGRRYPWGDTYVHGLSNGSDYGQLDDGFKELAPVGSFPDGVSPFGVHDMFGNVMEWVADYYDPNYYAVSPIDNPQGPAVTQGFRSMRGWSFDTADENYTVVHRRAAAPNYPSGDFGFRCALTP